MTKENAKQFLPLVQAIADGKTIQVKSVLGDGWNDMDSVCFDYPDASSYRIKPELDLRSALPPSYREELLNAVRVLNKDLPRVILEARSYDLVDGVNLVLRNFSKSARLDEII